MRWILFNDLFLSQTSSWRYKFSPLFTYFQFHRKLIKFIKCVLEGAGDGICSLRRWRDPGEYHRPATSLYLDSKQGRIVDKQVFYRCAVQTSKCYSVHSRLCHCIVGAIFLFGTRKWQALGPYRRKRKIGRTQCPETSCAIQTCKTTNQINLNKFAL